LLELKGIEAKYDDMQVLFGVSMRVDANEIVALVGSNAVGKTTLLKIISAVLKQSAGSIILEGRDISHMSSMDIVDLGIIHIPEGRKLFPHMSVQENLEVGSITRRSKKDRKSNLEMVYGLFPKLKERRRQMAGSLSGGEQQMCAIGRGLMGNPKLLMLDEPSLGLAPIIVMEVFEIIRKLHEQGVTILLVEQNVQHSLKIAQRGYVLEHGRIIMEGSGEELLENPHLKTAYLGL